MRSEQALRQSAQAVDWRICAGSAPRADGDDPFEVEGDGRPGVAASDVL